MHPAAVPVRPVLQQFHVRHPGVHRRACGRRVQADALQGAVHGGARALRLRAHIRVDRHVHRALSRHVHRYLGRLRRLRYPATTRGRVLRAVCRRDVHISASACRYHRHHQRVHHQPCDESSTHQASVDDRRTTRFQRLLSCSSSRPISPIIIAAVGTQDARRGQKPAADHHPDPGLIELRARLHPGVAALCHVQDPAVGTHPRVSQGADDRRQLQQGSLRRRLRDQLLPVHDQRPSVPRPAEEDCVRLLRQGWR